MNKLKTSVRKKNQFSILFFYQRSKSMKLIKLKYLKNSSKINIKNCNFFMIRIFWSEMSWICLFLFLEVHIYFIITAVFDIFIMDWLRLWFVSQFLSNPVMKCPRGGCSHSNRQFLKFLFIRLVAAPWRRWANNGLK